MENEDRRKRKRKTKEEELNAAQDKSQADEMTDPGYHTLSTVGENSFNLESIDTSSKKVDQVHSALNQNATNEYWRHIIQESNEKIESLNKELDDCKKEAEVKIKAIHADIMTKEKELNAAQDELNVAQDGLKAAQDKLNAVHEVNANLREELSSVKARMSEIEANKQTVKALSEKIEDLKKELESKERKLKVLENIFCDGNRYATDKFYLIWEYYQELSEENKEKYLTMIKEDAEMQHRGDGPIDIKMIDQNLLLDEAEPTRR
uniref:Uncharacterized protein n=1 Tax=Acrobeloides nanus TaxID=290746 RepID=A0A914BY91_9BILA